MKKVHVFNAGPCLLPQVAIDNAIEALKDFKGTGVSVLSISHRTKEWDATMDECRALWRELLNIPETHEIVFLGGGASLQFLYVAMNYLEKKAAYLETGVWAKKALKEVIDEAGLEKALEERTDLKYITDVAPDNYAALKEKFGVRIFATPKKMGAQTAEANMNAGLAAARQIVDFFATGNTRFQVNK